MNASSHEIESRLKLVRGRIRNAQRCRASWVITTVALGGLLLIMAADWSLAPLPVAVAVNVTAVETVAVRSAPAAQVGAPALRGPSVGPVAWTTSNWSTPIEARLANESVPKRGSGVTEIEKKPPLSATSAP